MTISAYEDQVNGLQRKAKESDNYFNHLSSQTAKEKDAYFAGILQKTNQEAHAEQKGLENEFNRNLGQMRASVDKDQALSQKASEQQLTRANALAADSLEKQALVNQETLRNQKTQDSDKIKHLEGSIQNTKNSSDISEISPSVEENVRNYVAKGYEKNFQLERNRNRESEDIIRQTYTQKMHEVSAEKEQASTRSLRAQEALHHDEKSLLMAGIQDAEFTKDSTLRAKDQTAARSQDTLLRTYGQSLEHQKREYENIIDALRADSSTKLTAQRQESDFERKMAQRTFATQQNELIRESEKKLSDQKLEYESRFDLLKSQAQQAVQEAERRARTSLEEQGRNYEQRLTQLETQNKERERYTAQNYEDQLEKVKRSNALLIQKKS